MKISTAILLSTVISLATVTSVVAGGCVTGATSDRDQCLCGCIRSGYNCTSGEDLMSTATEDELKERCKANIVAGGPCRWDPNASRSDGSTCGACETTNLCYGGTVDPPAPSPPSPDDGGKCANVVCSDDNCPGNCCVKGPKGTCGGPKRLRN